MKFELREKYEVEWIDSMSIGSPDEWQHDTGEIEKRTLGVRTMGYVRNDTEKYVEIIGTAAEGWFKNKKGSVKGWLIIPKVSIIGTPKKL